MAEDEATRAIPLEDRHLAHGAKMTPFAGFMMPLQYEGLQAEHHAVRQHVGLFDVSHMGEVEVRGPGAIEMVDGLVSNDVSALVDGQALYALLLNEGGTIVDDLVLYRLAADHILICINASRREVDVAHMREHARGDAELVDRGDAYCQLALQGPRAEALLATLTEVDLSELAGFRARRGAVAGHEVLIARTGYTGEDGFELYIEGASAARAVFDGLVEAGPAYGLKLCGLGARDTLRLESKMMLYGNDIDTSTNPLEAGLSWAVKLDKATPFVGREAVRAVKEAGVRRRMRTLTLEGRRIARRGSAIMVGDEQVGEVTSGGWSPTLEVAIALGYVDIAQANAAQVEVDIRGRRAVAQLGKAPFYRRSATES